MRATAIVASAAATDTWIALCARATSPASRASWAPARVLHSPHSLCIVATRNAASIWPSKPEGRTPA